MTPGPTRVGITVSSRFDPDGPITPGIEAYCESIATVGGVPVVLPPQTEVASVIRRVDALVLSGGGDVHPDRFSQPFDERTRNLDERRDEFEWELLRTTLAAGRPVLGICRGAQLLNVFLGGTLHLDLDSDRPGSLQHASSGDVEAHHTVVTRPGSALSQIIGIGPLEVNSFHHQSVRTTGAGLIDTAWAADGVCEALEHVELPFVTGVQWHPERLDIAHPSRRLFGALAAAASMPIA